MQVPLPFLMNSGSKGSDLFIQELPDPVMDELQLM